MNRCVVWHAKFKFGCWCSSADYLSALCMYMMHGVIAQAGGWLKGTIRAGREGGDDMRVDAQPAEVEWHHQGTDARARMMCV
jgi:hypothetical protein